MDNQKKKVLAALLLVIPVVCIMAIIIIIKNTAPSKERIELTDYYPVEDGKVLLVMQDEIWEKPGLYLEGRVYVDYETVVSQFNSRFYWDANENIMIYTTPSQVIKAEVGSKEYFVNKSKTDVSYQIIKVIDDVAYIAEDYIELFSNVTSKFYENPNRMVYTYKWDKKYQAAQTKKKTVLREGDNKKTPILYDIEKDAKLVFLPQDKEEESKYRKVITEDGVIGYVDKKALREAADLELTSDFVEESYPSISKDYTINMVWHQVTNQDANNGLLNLLDSTKGVTTVAPTWFSLADTKGAITSLASETYVNRAHSAGVEVWALCDDFNVQDANVNTVLSYTSRREKLENELVAAAIRFNLDGLNIDFENVTAANGDHFIQFIRELSVKCRSNGIVLSVDNYAPGFTGYFNRKEQGIVADYVITMAYDEHTGGSEESGSVSSINFFKKAITDTLKEVPKEKLIVGLPFYTRLWKEVTEGENVSISSEAYGMNSGRNVLLDNGVEPYWDETSGQYYGEFEKDGALWRMWLEDAESIELKMKAVDEAEAAGIAGWKLGLESRDIWDVIIKYVN